MRETHLLRRGAASLFLLLSLTACGSTAVRTEIVEVDRPVIVGVPKEMTNTPPRPQLPPGPLVNEDVLKDRDAWVEYALLLEAKLRAIAGLVPLEPQP